MISFLRTICTPPRLDYRHLLQETLVETDNLRFPQLNPVIGFRPHHIFSAIALTVALVSQQSQGVVSNIPKAPSASVGITTPTPWVRVQDGIKQMRLSQNNRFMAFLTDQDVLKIIDLTNQNIYLVTGKPTDTSFFWSPGGYRLFYRESYLQKSQPKSSLKVYDAAIHKSVLIEELPYHSGFLSFDPRDLRLHMTYDKGIRTKRINFPDGRLAKWQQSQLADNGKWIATPKAMLWATKGGLVLNRVVDDASGVATFQISPNGENAVWATKNGYVYVSRKGKSPIQLGEGRDPSWHPKSHLVVYAAYQTVGRERINLDLRVADTSGEGRYLLKSQFSDEVAPQWDWQGQTISFTRLKTTDIFRIRFEQ